MIAFEKRIRWHKRRGSRWTRREVTYFCLLIEIGTWNLCINHLRRILDRFLTKKFLKKVQMFLFCFFFISLIGFFCVSSWCKCGKKARKCIKLTRKKNRFKGGESEKMILILPWYEWKQSNGNKGLAVRTTETNLVCESVNFNTLWIYSRWFNVCTSLKVYKSRVM